MARRIPLLLTLLFACGDTTAETQSTPTDPLVGAACEGDVLFGLPNDKTGLSSEACQPRCTCGDEPWDAPLYSDAEVEQLLSWELLDPPAPLAADPYDAPAPPEPGAEVVCAVLADPPGARSYRLVTYESSLEAQTAGATPTHQGPCGLCSPLPNLAVYMRHPDLTDPVRQCGLDHAAGPPDAHIECLMALGFDLPCAQIWYFNTLSTRQKCLDPCIAALGQPYHLTDGSLNACLVCDEEQSGPVFKAVAGRTRRNTGLPNAMCRPCNEVRRFEHHYD